MNYRSTRGNYEVGFSEAILTGLAPDGGLFVPVSFPSFDSSDFEGLDLVEMSLLFLQPFLIDDPLIDHLVEICETTFSIPLELGFDQIKLLKEYLGPTGAFKDFGATFLAQCFSKMDLDLTVLVATSGDTGSAVASAFYGSGVKVVVLYPHGQISQFQENQMLYYGDNIHSLAVKGDFDSCQQLVKKAFQSDLGQEFGLTSSNSINIGRLLPQCLFYVFASVSFHQQYGKPPNLIIPTGNMGNALSAIWVRHMGFPIGEIKLSCNANQPIPNYFKTGSFTPQESIRTLANAMDVGTPSNMERFLQLVSDQDMYGISARSVDDDQIREQIKRAWSDYNLMICPHTATALYMVEDQDLDIVVATADPYKFREVIEPIIGQEVPIPIQLEKFRRSMRRPIVIEPELSEIREKISKIYERSHGDQM